MYFHAYLTYSSLELISRLSFTPSPILRVPQGIFILSSIRCALSSYMLRSVAFHQAPILSNSKGSAIRVSVIYQDLLAHFNVLDSLNCAIWTPERISFLHKVHIHSSNATKMIDESHLGRTQLNSIVISNKGVKNGRSRTLKFIGNNPSKIKTSINVIHSQEVHSMQYKC